MTTASKSDDQVKTYEAKRFSVNDVLSLKRNFRMGSTGRQPVISVVIPAKDCGEFIGNIVSTIRGDLTDKAGLIDEIIVVNHNSTDDTARQAELAGARVVDFDSVMTDCTTGGKGSVMRKGVWAANGDIVVFVDGDHKRFDSFKVVNLVAPLLMPDSGVIFTKGYYAGYGGGRSTETIGRATISMFDPELAAIQQPFSGEQATFRSVFADISVPEGWYIELSLLHQVKKRFGAHAIGQVDLEYKDHEHGETSHITRQVHEIFVNRLAEAMTEAGLEMPKEWSTTLSVPGENLGEVSEREPLMEFFSALSCLDGWKKREAQRRQEIANSKQSVLGRLMIDVRRILIKD
jgi:glucosyl-3-phosphoglycerate synthase